MRHLDARRLPASLKATGLAISILVGGTACGVDAASADSQAVPQAATAPAGAGSGQAVLDDLREPSHQADARRRLRALEASSGSRIGAYALDTATGRMVAYRSGERFPMLSTFKALAAAAVLQKARTSDPGLMDRVVHWKASEVKANSPMTERHVEDGMTVAQLCEAAITLSDNTAGNMLLKQIGGPAGLTKYLRTLKDPISRLDRWETELNDWNPKEKRDTTTPAAMARNLREVTSGNALDTRDRARLNAWLRANKTGDERIRAGLPKTWIIGDKTGSSTNYGSTNDIAVIRTSESASPLIMAIYTTHRAADAPNDNKVIADTATILARALGKLG
ncbi:MULTISPECIES: class A beta-lactamase [Streptosporangium]|uniref:Beta-lactamase n=1 Tax=Streptosporangium brasiliense TaxID=47480 RepID=A0ABT9QYL3_9ACTN|nr:class A beta-lactamase [Streptosporangium brasiliense]MDP9861290.1 beta-lactamase class A [Streptosporangium brasiliense]